jgi:integrase
VAIRVLVRFKRDRQQFQLYYIDPQTGREVSRATQAADRDEAQKAAGVWESELLDYRGADDSGWQHFRDRLREEHLPTLAPRTQQSYSTALNKFQDLVKPKSLSEVTPGVLSLYQAKLRQSGLASETVNSYMMCLKAAFNWAVAVEIVDRAPKIRLPKKQHRKFMRSRPLTEAEYATLLGACEKLSNGAMWRRFVELLWFSGMRLSEAMKLSWDSPPILVQLDVRPYPQVYFYGEGQKSRKDEAMPIPPDFAAWLAKTPPALRRGPVAPVPTVYANYVSKMIARAGERAGVIVDEGGKWASPHDLRRSFGTRWAQRVMPMTLKAMMRHEDIQTTLRYYIGLSATDAGRELWGSPVPNNVPKTPRKRRNAG